MGFVVREEGPNPPGLRRALRCHLAPMLGTVAATDGRPTPGTLLAAVASCVRGPRMSLTDVGGRFAGTTTLRDATTVLTGASVAPGRDHVTCRRPHPAWGTTGDNCGVREAGGLGDQDPPVCPEDPSCALIAQWTGISGAEAEIVRSRRFWIECNLVLTLIRG